ncbi:MAG: methionyl-tRNA formyltransferase, partial [Deltaproteobacteria bacterium]
FKLWRSRRVEGSGAPGEVIDTDNRLVIACGEGAVELLEAQLPGKRRQAGRDLVNGARIEVGERFDDPA